MNYKLDHLAFRRDVQSDNVDGFDRGLQLEMCARQLESLRATVPERWACLGTQQALSTGRLEDLIPISDRTVQSLDEYKLFKAGKLPTSNALDTLERLEAGAD